MNISKLIKAIPLIFCACSYEDEALMDLKIDDKNQDYDEDGIIDSDEYLLGTDPRKYDSDTDGWSDGEEIDGNTDPLDRDDYPYMGGWPIGSCRNDLRGSVLQAGEVAPQFQLTDMYGDTVKLHDFCHMAVLVVTGAAWCGPCQEYRSEAAAFYESYYAKGLMIIDLLGENESGGRPTQTDLEEWADGNIYAVVADPGWAVTNQGYASGGIPAISLLAPGAEAFIINGYPTAADIESVLPDNFTMPE